MFLGDEHLPQLGFVSPHSRYDGDWVRIYDQYDKTRPLRSFCNDTLNETVLIRASIIDGVFGDASRVSGPYSITWNSNSLCVHGG